MLYSEFRRFGFRSSTLSATAAFVGFARRHARFSRARHRKRCFTRLMQSAHTARPSRRLLSTTAPGSRRAGHAVCLRLRWLERLFGFRSSASVTSSSIQSPTPFDSLTRLHLSVSCSSMRRVSPSLRGICIRESRPSSGVFRIVAESLSTSEMTPNHALQRTAPRVTLAAARHPATFAHPAPTMSPQPARRAPQSLSLGSLGVATRLV